MFPGIDNSGCLFHFNQAVLRNFNSIGLKSAYEDKPVNPATGRRGASETKKHIRRACALAFVSVQDVPAAWDKVSQQFPVTPEFDRFVTYFERTWVGKRNTNPIYAINKWNMRDRVLNSLLTVLSLSNPSCPLKIGDKSVELLRNLAPGRDILYMDRLRAKARLSCCVSWFLMQIIFLVQCLTLKYPVHVIQPTKFGKIVFLGHGTTCHVIM